MKFLQRNSLYLAPMAGFTDSNFRRIARSCGADVTVSEFVYSRAVLLEKEKIFEKISFSELERPYGVQIFGSDEIEVADAAQLIEEKFFPDFIDINFGCPAPNAVSAGAGSALLKNPFQMAKIISTVKDKLKKIPCTAKMRIGWDANNIVLPYAAKMLEDAGVDALAIHGRTRSQGYSGDSNWSLIEETARILQIPVIGNGTVEKLSESELKNSACFGFMIGRSTLGNPWIFRKIKDILTGEKFYTEPSVKNKIALILEYCQGFSDRDIIFARPNILAFLKGFRGSKELRLAVSRVKTFDELKNILDSFNLC